MLWHMGFYERAYGAAAEEYGRQRAEKYGRIARAWQVVKVTAAIALVIGIIYMWHVGGQG